MSEVPGPGPKDLGISPEVEREVSITELVNAIASLPQKARLEVAETGEWPQLVRDMYAVRDRTQSFEFPKTFDPEKAESLGKEFLAYLANNASLFSTLMNRNENYQSLQAIHYEQSKNNNEQKDYVTITAQELRAAGERGEVDFPRHLSIAPNDLQRLRDQVTELRLFVAFPDKETGVFSANMVTLKTNELGILDENNQQTSAPAKILVIPYDVFVNPVYAEEVAEIDAQGETTDSAVEEV